MQMHLATRLEALQPKVATALRRPATLLAVSRPLLIFRGSLPGEWQPGRYRLTMYLFGFIPLGWQDIGVSFPPADEGTFRLRDNGGSPLLRRWEHDVVARCDGNATLYSDTIEIDAGWLTPLLWLFVRLLFGHRQRRWRRLARQL
jgi:hypothetical protein